MATVITCNYTGDNQTELVHGPTGARITTDLPPDNGGKGRTFSPTDLFAASLASCALTIMAKLAQREGADFSGAAIEVEKVMATEPPRRVAEFRLRVKLPQGIAPEKREKYLAGIKACPVHMSLHPDIKVSWQ